MKSCLSSLLLVEVSRQAKNMYLKSENVFNQIHLKPFLILLIVCTEQPNAAPPEVGGWMLAGCTLVAYVLHSTSYY